MDWILTFCDKFKQYKEIQQLKAERFHGSVTLNFSDGVVQNYEMKLCRRAENSNLTKGG